MEKVYEQFFSLKYHGGWSLFEAYNLPIVIRRWFLRRLAKQKKEESDANQEAMRQAKAGKSSPRRY